MRKARSLKRAAPSRLPKRKFIIFSEGKNTEPDYFRALERDLIGALLDLEIVGAAGTPMTIAEKACERLSTMKRRGRKQSSFEEGDQVWAVFDRDEHPRVSEAIERCRVSGIGLAFSDPCFEVWLILHFRDFDRPDDRHQVQAALSKECSGYDPSGRKTDDFSKIMTELVRAEERAEKQLARREKESETPSRPFTTVFRLTKAIRKAHAEYQNPHPN